MEPMQVFVYPNPATSRSCLELGVSQPCRIQFEVVDALGRLVYQMEEPDMLAGEHKIELSMENWSDGQYYLLVKATLLDGKVFSKNLKLQKSR
jgi:hypothetical protein